MNIESTIKKRKSRFWVWFFVFIGLPLFLLFVYMRNTYGRLTEPIHAVASAVQSAEGDGYRYVPVNGVNCEADAQTCGLMVGHQAVEFTYRFSPPGSPFGACSATIDGQRVSCRVENRFYPWKHIVVLGPVDQTLPSWRQSVETYLASISLGDERAWWITMVIVATIGGLCRAVWVSPIISIDKSGQPVAIAQRVAGAMLLAYLIGFMMYIILMFNGVILD